VALVTAVAADGAFAPLLGTRRLALDDDGDTLQADLVGSLAQGEIEALVAAVQDALQQNEPTLWTHLAPAGRLDCFIEVQSPPRHLIICGAGHIAVPLAAMASTAGFEVTVIDDRAQYANTTRFPAPTRVLAGDFRAELRSLRAGRLHFGRGVCLVLVTRGHQHDVECLLETLDDPLAYVGMIGSRRRIRAVFEMLAQEQGIERARFDHVHAPIGLDIEAHTPAEIAIAILAEIVNTLRGGPALSLRDSTSTVRGRRRNDAARGEGA
jgi:xanthine dehydrogenase accessory factor